MFRLADSPATEPEQSTKNTILSAKLMKVLQNMRIIRIARKFIMNDCLLFEIERRLHDNTLIRLYRGKFRHIC